GGLGGVRPGAAAAGVPVSLREVLERRITDSAQHTLSSLVSVLVAGVACGCSSFLAIAGRGGGLGSRGAGVSRDAPQTGDRRKPP
ncbi:MAG TPA: hypothetical protein VIV12_12685, partial [Streptosporangiaceae bacterium]